VSIFCAWHLDPDQHSVEPLPPECRRDGIISRGSQLLPPWVIYSTRTTDKRCWNCPLQDRGSIEGCNALTATYILRCCGLCFNSNHETTREDPSQLQVFFRYCSFSPYITCLPQLELSSVIRVDAEVASTRWLKIMVLGHVADKIRLGQYRSLPEGRSISTLGMVVGVAQV